MESFTYTSPLSRVLMAENAVDSIGEEVERLGCKRALVVCGSNVRRTKLLQRVVAALGSYCMAVFDEVVEHPDVTLVTKGTDLAQRLGVDVLVPVGGGSASDTAKGIAILLAEGGHIRQHASIFIPPDKFYPKELQRPKVPIVAVPTTASAAEVTPGVGIKDEQGLKLGLWDVKVASRVIIIDPAANLETPVAVMSTTAMNAFAHCVEGLYSRLRSPISDALALEGTRILDAAIPKMVNEPASVDARARVLAGANISGMVISNARVGIHHAVCHCIGAHCRVAHGVANSVMLPHALRYNLDVAASQLKRVAQAMGKDVGALTDLEAASLAIEAVEELQVAARVPRRLRDVGVAKEALTAIAEHVMQDRGLYFNPKPTLSVEPVLALLEAAW